MQQVSISVTEAGICSKASSKWSPMIDKFVSLVRLAKPVQVSRSTWVSRKAIDKLSMRGGTQENELIPDVELASIEIRLGRKFVGMGGLIPFCASASVRCGCEV